MLLICTSSYKIMIDDVMQFMTTIKIVPIEEIGYGSYANTATGQKVVMLLRQPENIRLSGLYRLVHVCRQLEGRILLKPIVRPYVNWKFVPRAIYNLKYDIISIYVEIENL